MCGILGLFQRESIDTYKFSEIMLNDLLHRGPDQKGTWADGENNFSLGHVRLSIQDLTDAGRQPMSSRCGRYVLVFNGEIYNFRKIKKLLIDDFQITEWKGTSDTEVLLNAFIHIGFEKSLKLLNGMFALAFYDQENKELFLARDRFGEKPLYVYSSSDTMCFSSELRAIEKADVTLTLNPVALDSLLRYSYIAAPLSIYKEVSKFPAAHFYKISLAQDFCGIDLSQAKSYWSLESELENKNEYIGHQEALLKTESLLQASVADRMISDVPFGAFLSGGLDSTAIVAMMKDISSSPVKTFTIGFHDSDYNEAHHAKAVAKHLGTEHSEIYLNESDMLSVIPNLSQIFDEPFADSSQLPTYMVSKFAREHVTVALTGDAGDEFFGGYNRYIWGPTLVKNFSGFPLQLRQACSALASSISPVTYDKSLKFLLNLVSHKKDAKRLGDKIHKTAHAIKFSSEKNLYERLICVSHEHLLNNKNDIFHVNVDQFFYNSKFTFPQKMMYSDITGYMQNDILAKVDRASMAVSLETRVPFLDNDLVRFTLSLPDHLKINNGKSKFLLRELVKKHVPDQLMEREKSGFGVPIYSWLRNELRDWAESLLSTDKLLITGLLDAERIRFLWEQHLKGKANNQYIIWNVLMFQSWMEDRNWKVGLPS